jgi:mannose-6-phosphate isomerase-like protein (cupin superfamily)
MEAIDLSDKLSRFSDKWAPKIIAQLNDYHIKLAKIEGQFIWHSHPETDELFFLLDGTMIIQMREGNIELKPGQMFVVPKGMAHKPVAGEECHVMLIEPAGTVNTGDAGGEMTFATEQWI